MAKQSGLIKIEGSIDDLSFYKTKRGNFIRKKGGVSRDRILKDPKFRRTRENGQEFVAMAASSTLLTRALRLLTRNISDGTARTRLMSVLAKIKNLDLTSDRGQRNVATGINHPSAKVLLKGFSFGEGTVFDKIVQQKYTVDPLTGEITINDLNPELHIEVPEGATHANFVGGWARVDFASGNHELQLTNSVLVPLTNANNNLLLTPAASPTQAGVNLHLLKVEFVQELNGKTYALSNSTYNAMVVVDVI